ncbi:hypothetical protein HH308_19915 [Gordonia sp. TBRC 11910]|uniref:YrhK-like protein n=1 Tax=Gordonia asplenii TaxID=2725283 RepID=A0A848L349_9ACTN|nr:hypothetical protein [Gordonia asplenii]NMO03485.1 hypothetical protein [Gordonia asplenii]
MTSDESTPGAVLALTPLRQCGGFMIGSALFAVGSAPYFASWAGADVVNICYFVGAIFFTAAGLIQLLVSGPATVPAAGSGVMVRADWLSASTQFAGTILFNASTTAALMASGVVAQRQNVWSPDAAGSVAFLVSGALGLYALRAGTSPAPRDAQWWSAQINFVGCVAFGVSAVGSFVTRAGGTLDASVASIGTFIGALCFFAASAVLVPSAR